MGSKIEKQLSAILRSCDNSYTLDGIQYPDNVFIIDAPSPLLRQGPGLYLFYSPDRSGYDEQKLLASLSAYLRRRSLSVGPLSMSIVTAQQRILCDDHHINYIKLYEGNGRRPLFAVDRLYYDPFGRCGTYDQHTASINMVIVFIVQFLFYQLAPNLFERSIFKRQISYTHSCITSALGVPFDYKLKFYSADSVCLLMSFRGCEDFNLRLNRDMLRCTNNRVVYDDFYFSASRRSDPVWLLEKSFLNANIKFREHRDNESLRSLQS